MGLAEKIPRWLLNVSSRAGERVKTENILINRMLDRPAVPIERKEPFEPNSLSILDIHYKNGTDGVSLVAMAIDKGLRDDEEIGSEIHYHYGGATIPKIDARELPARGIQLDKLSYQSPEAIDRRQRLFTIHPPTGQKAFEAEQHQLLGEIYRDARELYHDLKQYIVDNQIGTLIVRNIMSMALNPAATLAHYWLAVDPDLNSVQIQFMHHDLYTEPVRAHKYETPYPLIKTLIGAITPPLLPGRENVVHACLNPEAQRRLEEQGIYAEIISDAIDFKALEKFTTRKFQPVPEGHPFSWREAMQIPEDEFDWHTFFGLGEHDLMICVPTRVTDRKAISIAIQLVAKLQDPQRRAALIEATRRNGGAGVLGQPVTEHSHFVLCLPQFEDTIDNLALIANLKALAKVYGVDIRFASDRMLDSDQHRLPSNHDFYAVYGQSFMQLLTSIQEGFGNQAGEVIASGNPLVVFRYPNYDDLQAMLPAVVPFGGYARSANQRIDVADNKGLLGGIPTAALEGFDAEGPHLWFLTEDEANRAAGAIVEMLSLPPDELRQRCMEKRAQSEKWISLPAVVKKLQASLPFGLRKKAAPASAGAALQQTVLS